MRGRENERQDESRDNWVAHLLAAISACPVMVSFCHQLKILRHGGWLDRKKFLSRNPLDDRCLLRENAHATKKQLYCRAITWIFLPYPTQQAAALAYRYHIM